MSMSGLSLIGTRFCRILIEMIWFLNIFYRFQYVSKYQNTNSSLQLLMRTLQPVRPVWPGGGELGQDWLANLSQWQFWVSLPNCLQHLHCSANWPAVVWSTHSCSGLQYCRARHATNPVLYWSLIIRSAECRDCSALWAKKRHKN